MAGNRRLLGLYHKIRLCQQNRASHTMSKHGSLFSLSDFSFTESQTICFITSLCFDSFSSKSVPTSNWSWNVSSSVKFTNSQMQSPLFPPTLVGNTVSISHRLGEGNPSCHSTRAADVLTHTPWESQTEAKRKRERAWRQGHDNVLEGQGEVPGSWAQWEDEVLISPSLLAASRGWDESPVERTPSKAWCHCCHMQFIFYRQIHTATSFCKSIRESTYTLITKRQLF